MTKIYLWIIFFAAVIPIGLYIYSSRYYLTYEKATIQRSEFLEKNNEEEILIGVIWNDPNGSFLKGVDCAVELLNNDVDKFNYYITDSNIEVKRKLKAIKVLMGNSKASSQLNAINLSKEATIAAVVGQPGSVSAIPASITYNYNGVPYLSPVATSDILTKHNFSYVFRNAPRDSDFAKALINFCHKKKYQKIAVIYCRDNYGISFSNFFVEAAAGLNSNKVEEKAPLTILLQKSYSGNQKVFLPMIAEIIESKADCIFIAGGFNSRAGLLIKQIRQMGLRVPILGGDGLEDVKLVDEIGKYAGELYVASVFDRNYIYPKGSLFDNAKKLYYDKNKTEPDYEATQGFEAIYILAQAFKKTQSTHPLTITSFLKVYDEFQGINGTVSFSKEGNIEGKPVFINQLIDGNFDRIKEE